MPDLASMDLDETEAKTIENYTCVYFISDGGKSDDLLVVCILKLSIIVVDVTNDPADMML
jgi:hypothetical protein